MELHEKLYKNYFKIKIAFTHLLIYDKLLKNKPSKF